MFEIQEPLNTRFLNAVKLTESCEFVRILAHYDVDGISSAALIASVFLKRNIPFHASFVKDLGTENVEKLMKEDSCYILVDMGSSLISFLENYKNVIVLDHHPMEKDSEKIININPHVIHMNGAKNGCGATLSFLFALYADPELFSKYPLYLVGVIGDKQDLNGFSGLNKMIVEKIEEINKPAIDWKLQGKTVKDSLFLATEPYLSGITGNMEAVDNILKKLGISETDEFETLPESKKTALISSISLHLLKQGALPETVIDSMSQKFYIQEFQMSDRALSNYINAASRSDRQDLGFSFLLGDKEKQILIIETWKEYKNKVLKELTRIEKETVKLENLQYFYTSEESICGSLAGIAMLYFLDQSKVTVCLHVKDSQIHVSSRATNHLVNMNVDLGKSVKESAEKVGGYGGGHNIAAGATIPKDKDREFLELFDSLLKKI